MDRTRHQLRSRAPGLLAAALLATAPLGAALAQDAGPAQVPPPPPRPMEKQQPEEPSATPPMAPERVTLEGTVRSVDVNRGSLKLRTGDERTVEVRGHPEQIREYRQGQEARIEASLHQDRYWIAEAPDQTQTAEAESTQAASQDAPPSGETARAEPSGQQPQAPATAEAQPPAPAPGTLVGRVTSVERSEGHLTVEVEGRDRRFRAHPATLQDVAAGQFVSLTYEEAEGAPWVSEIQGQIQPAQPGDAAEGGTTSTVDMAPPAAADEGGGSPED